jgi:hypothetical protein
MTYLHLASMPVYLYIPVSNIHFSGIMFEFMGSSVINEHISFTVISRYKVIKFMFQMHEDFEPFEAWCIFTWV